jgi:hypothetical protein
MAKKAKKKRSAAKTIAGVKVPKLLRASSLSTLIESPLGRTILADALVAAATAAAAALVKHRPSSRQVAAAGEAVADAGGDAAAATRDTVQSAAGAVATLVTEAAQHILPSSMTGADDDNGKDREKNQRYAHLADDNRKGKKDKSRPKASKH